MKRKIKELIKSVLHMKGKPKDVALAFSIGVFIAFFPIFGIHTIMAIGGAWALGLSPAVALAGTLVNNPWTIAFIYGSGLYVGLAVTGRDLGGIDISWGNLTMDTMVMLVKTLFIPFSIGCILLGVVAALISYVVTLKTVVSYRNRRQTLQGEAEGGS